MGQRIACPRNYNSATDEADFIPHLGCLAIRIRFGGIQAPRS